MEVSDLVSSTRQFVDELEQYRAPWESKTHWYARKTFLRHNWDNFDDKDRLICLSTAWANVHFMGNRYPAKVMQLLKSMEEGMDSANALLHEADKQVTGNNESLPVTKDLQMNIVKLPVGIKPMYFVKKTIDEKLDVLSDTSKTLESKSHKTEQKKTMIKKKVKSAKAKPTLAPAFKGASCSLSEKRFSQGKSSTFDVSCLKRSCNEVLNSAEPATASLEQADKYMASSNATGKPNKIQIDFIKRLSSLLIEKAPLMNPSNRPQFFSSCMQQLQCNPVFEYKRVVRSDMPLFLQWEEDNDRKLHVNCGMCVCDVYAGNIFIAQGYNYSKIIAKNSAVHDAMEMLMSSPYVVHEPRIKDDNQYVWQHALRSHSISSKVVDLPPILTSPSFLYNLKSNDEMEKSCAIPGWDKNAVSSVYEYAQSNRICCDFQCQPDVNNGWTCTITFDGDVIATCSGTSIKSAKLAAAEITLISLKDKITATKQRKKHQPGGSDETQRISRSDITGIHETYNSAAEQMISEDNIGNKLLRKMGWSGSGGIGKKENGIAVPVKVNSTHGRAGFGAAVSVSYKHISAMLNKFISDGCVGEMVFSSDLTNLERKKIHQRCRSYGLCSKSYGKNEKRYLVVSRKLSRTQLIDELMDDEDLQVNLLDSRPHFTI